MKKILIAAAAIVVMVSAAWAAQETEYGGRANGGYRYDPAKTEVLSGVVSAIKEIESPRGKGVIITLNTAGSATDVHLGPRFFLDEQQVKIAVGDTVQITGVQSTRRGDNVFIAGEVKKGDQVLKLRDDNGRPLWAGKGPGPGKRRAKAAVGC